MVALRAEGVRAFFAFARRRHEITIRRAMNLPPPWTNDPVLAQYRFTNVFREMDRTTVWCRRHVRDRYEGRPELLPAVVVFRWFNKIETGEAMFGPYDIPPSGMPEGSCPFDYWLKSGEVDHLRRIIVHFRGDGPYVNGAYIVRSPSGMSKLDGVLQMCERFRTEKVTWTSTLRHSQMGGWDWRDAAHAMATGQWNLEQSWDWLRQHDHQGDFTAYEVVTDLRHTHLLRGASDIMTWANPGPGAQRGLNRVQDRPVEKSQQKFLLIQEMRSLLAASQSPLFWPPEWGKWEMREVEHTLCESDKYARVINGEGFPKQRYQLAASPLARPTVPRVY